MNAPFPSEPKPAAGTERTIAVKPQRKRAGKWSDLHSALAQLIEARELAVEDQIDGEGGGK